MTPKLRGYRPTDESFVYSSWLRSYWKSFNGMPWISHELYQKEQRMVIAMLLESPDVLIRVLCLSGEEDVVIGWAVKENIYLEGDYVHYVYVKEAFRKMGFATLLLDDLGCNPKRGKLKFTHLTARASKILEKHETAVFNPWLLMRSL